MLVDVGEEVCSKESEDALFTQPEVHKELDIKDWKVVEILNVCILHI